jgi:DNA-binding CsgD family transcriptional regulator
VEAVVISDSRLTPTRRELQVIKLLAAGLTNRQIARRMDIAECTVKNHLVNMFQRLGFLSRVHAVVVSLKNGWLRLSDIEDLAVDRTLTQVGRLAMLPIKRAEQGLRPCRKA